MHRFLLTALVSLLVATPAASQMITNIQIFPVVARGPGALGTFWVTDATITNPGPAPITIGMHFFQASRDNQINPSFPDRIVLAPGQTTLIEDVLLEAFRIDDNAIGMLVMISDANFIPGNPQFDAILAVTRTYNVGGPEGTYGQTIPSLPMALNAGWSSSFITGARNDGLFRSNLGIASPSPMGRIRVFYRITDADGTPHAEGSKEIGITSMGQWSFSSLGVGLVDGPLTVELWMDEANMSPSPCEDPIPTGFFAYVSKVDNGTGDAEYLTASPIAPFLCGAPALE